MRNGGQPRAEALSHCGNRMPGENYPETFADKFGTQIRYGKVLHGTGNKMFEGMELCHRAGRGTGR